MTSLRWTLMLACSIVVAVAAWPSAGWSRAARHACDVTNVTRVLLQNWANQLKDSTPDNTRPIVDTYGDNAVLLPTCKNGPLTGGKIADYFKGFVADKPVATFDMPSVKIGGTCENPFASGLYSFKLGNGRELGARFTYVFRQTGPASWKIAQHHSSLEPEANGACPD